MKKLFILIVFPLAFLLSGCLNDPVQNDLLNYVNEEIKPLADLEDTALTAFTNVSGTNYTDDETMYKAITEVAIPKYNEFISKLEAVQIDTKEVKSIHETYVEGAKIQYDALVKIKTALENQDSTLIAEANTMLEEGKALIDQYNDNLKKLIEEHDLELK